MVVDYPSQLTELSLSVISLDLSHLETLILYGPFITPEMLTGLTQLTSLRLFIGRPLDFSFKYMTRLVSDGATEIRECAWIMSKILRL